VLETQIVRNVPPSKKTSRQVGNEFRKLIEQGARLKPAGDAKDDPLSLLSLGYTPKDKLQLFGTTYYLTRLRVDDHFSFFVAYVLLPESPDTPPHKREIYPRIFYKDVSLVWRSATHYIRSEEDNWIGKGDLKTILLDGEEIEYPVEETTNLPLEIQSTLDVISRRAKRAQRDDYAVELILRGAPDGRFEPYSDFSAPRRKTMSDESNLINKGREIAYFRCANDPTSLQLVPGFEPDFERGIIEEFQLRSRMYGGEVTKFRILSKNRQIQYQFIAGPRQVWIIPPQTLTTEIMSYGVRTVDVHVPEDLCVPGYEYHYIDDSEDPPRLHSQIPRGFAAAASEVDSSRADASPWLEKLPVIQEFRKIVLRA